MVQTWPWQCLKIRHSIDMLQTCQDMFWAGMVQLCLDMLRHDSAQLKCFLCGTVGRGGVQARIVVISGQSWLCTVQLQLWALAWAWHLLQWSIKLNPKSPSLRKVKFVCHSILAVTNFVYYDSIGLEARNTFFCSIFCDFSLSHWRPIYLKNCKGNWYF